MNKEYCMPELDRKSFNCPHCGAFANQRWYSLMFNKYDTKVIFSNNNGPISRSKDIIFLDDNFRASKCDHCEKLVLWNDQKIIYPRSITVESPNPDMPEVAKGLYMESAKILQDSPRASAALLRLALQEILNKVVEGGEKNSINDNIGILSEGVDETTQKALDLIRINGNNAAHLGEIQIEEENTECMYKILNIIVQKTISDKKQIDDLYNNNVSENQKKSIKERKSKK